ncbi:unnamed protein product [Strongylus vulgaris]|uniref:Uncharacterized protein n=1 Tax=Strongylus vulgaris TaxID=40348 RepID=A0A3P7KFL6_STRVU|nr:unnamed protein product [Strongylus vulgaris]
MFEAGLWLKIMTFGPMILSTISIIFMLLTIHYIRQATKQCNTIVNSTHSLARCAVRLGVGPVAKKSIQDYAKTRPELIKLLNEDPIHPSKESS